MPFGFSHT